MFQHPDYNKLGAERQKIPYNNSLSKERVELPGEYTTLFPACFLKKGILVRELLAGTQRIVHSMQRSWNWRWNGLIKWSKTSNIMILYLYHSLRIMQSMNIIKTISSMLPQLKEDSHSVSLMTHAMQLRLITRNTSSVQASFIL